MGKDLLLIFHVKEIFSDQIQVFLGAFSVQSDTLQWIKQRNSE